ncbi:hypothetical protein AB0F07_36955 [Streptomyces fructofermentans]|uniref:hypothetical protein n=1 Tax=Streptomyces fructofermentans TaxID=152141 RepID=UPI0033CB03EA
MADTGYPRSHQPTLEDVRELAQFIQDRARDLARSSHAHTDEYRSAQALTDLVSLIAGAAEASAESSVRVQHFCLATAAKRWSDHPDFDPAWEWI